MAFPSGAIGLWHAENAAVTAGGVPYVPNEQSNTAASNSFIYLSRRQFSSYGLNNGTVVDNNAVGPDGLTEATTLTMTDGWFIYVRNISGNSNKITLPAGTYTIAVNAERATGSNQTFCFQCAGGAENHTSSTQTATSSWQRFTYTFTVLGNAYNIGLLGDGSNGATINICDLELFAGSSDLGPVAKAGHIYLGMSPNDSVPSTGGGFIDFSSGGVAMMQMLDASTQTYSAFTAMFLIDEVAAPNVANGGNSILTTPDGSSLVLYNQFNTTTFATTAIAFGGQNSTVTNSWCEMNGAGPHLLTFMFDGIDFHIFWDDTRIMFGAPPSAPSDSTLADFYIAMASQTTGPSSSDKIAAMALWNSALTFQQIYDSFDYLQSRYSTHFTMTAWPFYVFSEGDSITDGTGAANPYEVYVNCLSTPGSPNQNVFGFNNAIGGSTIASPGISFPGDYATNRIDNLLDSLPPSDRQGGRLFIISLYFGQNDYQSDQGFSLDPTGHEWITGTYEPYITSLKNGGFNKVIVGTIFSPGGTGGSAETTNQFNWRSGANSLIYSFVTNGIADAIMDFNGNSNLGAFQAGENGTYFNLSSTPHPSTLSQETIMAPLYLAALNSVLFFAVGPAFQNDAFQGDAFQLTEIIILETTSNSVIFLPINCVLSGNQPLELGKTIVEYNAPNIRVVRTPI